MTNRIVIINEGKIVADGHSDELRRDAMRENRYRVELGPNGTDAGDALRSLAGVSSVDRSEESNGSNAAWIVKTPLDRDPRKEINELARSKGWDLLELHAEQPTLEEAFIELTGKADLKTPAGSLHLPYDPEDGMLEAFAAGAERAEGWPPDHLRLTSFEVVVPSGEEG